MREFDYLQPPSLDEACRMMGDLGDDGRYIAGGTALLLALRQRMLAPTGLVSLERIEALRGISFDPASGLTIGALSRHTDVARSALVAEHAPVLASMAARVANPQVRNQGTIGGNLCYADPATDPPGCLMALDAEVVLHGPGGERRLSIEDFCVDYYTTALEPGEIVTAIRVPPMHAQASARYTRYMRTAAEHRPLASVAVVARHDGRHCTSARIVVGASVPVAARLRRAEDYLRDAAISERAIEEAADIVAQDISAISDQRGTEAYRRDMVRVATRRTLAEVFGLPSSPIRELAGTTA